MRRGDIVTAAPPGDHGKPRPVLIVQSDLFNDTHASVVICPLTSQRVTAPLFRVEIAPSKDNGLETVSQVMVDKLMAVKRERIDKVIGRLSDGEMSIVDRALRLWLDVESESRLC